MRKKIYAIIILVLIGGTYINRVSIKDWLMEITKPKLPAAIDFNEKINENTNLITAEQEITGDNTDELLDNALPSSYNLDVPFTSQAPLADWNDTFKEACEEASSLIVHYFYQNKKFSPAEATAEILAMVNWQLDYFGGHFDLTAEQTAEMIKKYLHYEKVEVLENPTINDIKFHLSRQRPVIMPAAGRELGNPYFRTPGPIYHMLVIKGYTAADFITNDPGTKRGENFLYSYDTIMQAMRDWHPDDIASGAKKIIIIYPNP